MKTNTLKQRLAVYKRALKDYEKGTSYELRFGFCRYFYEELGINVYDDFKKMLPELQKFQPKNVVMYWFKDGALYPRIGCLKKAIALTEKKIAQGKK